MFEDFHIPQTIAGCASYYYSTLAVQEKLTEIIPSGGINSGRTVWHANNGFDTMARIIQLICSAELEEGKTMNLRYCCNDLHRTITKAIDQNSTEYGILINEEASTHFREVDFPGATHLTAAEEMLKQSPQHFLKIFTMPENNTLFVYTNKMLEPPMLYRLLALDMSINNQKTLTKNKLGAEFINTLVDNDTEKAIKLLNEFLDSDRVNEYEMQELSKILRSTNDQKIRRLERKIEENRTNIAEYENYIAQLAVQIRESNQELDFLKSVDDSEEHKLFFKYLKRHPYIYSFSPKRDGYIELRYKAPIVYFNETPAKKYITRNSYTDPQKKIVKIILGNKYELWTKCTLRFNTQTFQVSVLTMNRDNDLLNHPHIDRFHCFGNHRQAINESAEAGDYIGAIEQLSQAVLNLNFYDGCVVEEMLKNIIDKWYDLVTWKCKETGEFLTTEQVIERGDYYEEA